MTTAKATEAEHHVGRPLDASRDVALRQAALELLAEIGYDRLTIDSVASRARASKTTIYRRWSGKAELVVDALNGLKGNAPVPDTGSLRGDLEAIVHGSTNTDTPIDAQLVIGLITALAHDGELRHVVRERLIDPDKARLKQVFERAVARGEVAEDRNLDLLVSLFPALAIQHVLIFGEFPDAQFAEQVMHDVILPLATAPPGVANGSSSARQVLQHET
ncbi:MAG TPA: TetR/AcrR family transcriptional regulator [Acidimicrobiales bacterium]